MTRVRKRITAPKQYELNRKENTYVVKGRGPANSIPITVVLRDKLGLAKTKKEVKNAARDGRILVDGRTIDDYKRGVGLMDVVTVGGTSYRGVPSKRGLDFIEIPKKESKVKLSKIIDKTVVKGGKIQLNLHDGNNILIDEDDYKTKDVLVMEIPDKKIKKSLSYEEGALAVVTLGKNSGAIGKIEKTEIEKSSRTNKVYINIDGETIEYPESYVLVIGKTKPDIKIAGE